jgi:copper resistance protein B
MPGRFLLACLLLACAAPSAAQRLRYDDPLAALDRPDARLGYADVVNAVDRPSPPEPSPAPEPAGPVRAFYGDRIEWRPQRGRDAFHWDVSAEMGGASNRLWLASVGDGLLGGPIEYVEAQALYSRPLGESGLSLQAGFRRDFVPRPRRSYGVLGLQGNLLEPLYVGAFGFLSNRGELTGRLFAYYDVPIGRRLVLQPAVESEIAGADVPELGIGAGPVYVEGGLRLRYRIAEAFAPYVGLNWERLLGRTARFAREADEAVVDTSLVLGVRSYF